MGSLSIGERLLIQGINWDDLPKSVVMSQTSQAACASVWQKYVRSQGTNRLEEAQRRLNSYLQSKVEAVDWGVESFRNRAGAYNFDFNAMEYVQRFYRDKDLESLLIGKVQGGLHGRVVWGEISDGIPSNQTILATHNHGDNTNFSDGDMARILSNDNDTPTYCLWYLIGSERLHLLVPTVDTPRVDGLKAYDDFNNEFEAKYGNNLCLDKLVPATDDFVLQIADRYKLGYYEGNRNSISLMRVR